MGKVLGAVFVGVVIGAAANEFLHRKKPDLYKNMSDKVKKGIGALKEAFAQGYAQASAPGGTEPEPVEAV